MGSAIDCSSGKSSPLLPERYSQVVIKQIAKLVKTYSKLVIPEFPST